MNKEELIQTYKQYNKALENLDTEEVLIMNHKIYEETFNRYLTASGRVKDSDKNELFSLIGAMESIKFLHSQLNNLEES